MYACLCWPSTDCVQIRLCCSYMNRCMKESKHTTKSPTLVSCATVIQYRQMTHMVRNLVYDCTNNRTWSEQPQGHSKHWESEDRTHVSCMCDDVYWSQLSLFVGLLWSWAILLLPGGLWAGEGDVPANTTWVEPGTTPGTVLLTSINKRLTVVNYMLWRPFGENWLSIRWTPVYCDFHAVVSELSVALVLSPLSHHTQLWSLAM